MLQVADPSSLDLLDEVELDSSKAVVAGSAVQVVALNLLLR